MILQNLEIKNNKGNVLIFIVFSKIKTRIKEFRATLTSGFSMDVQSTKDEPLDFGV